MSRALRRQTSAWFGVALSVVANVDCATPARAQPAPIPSGVIQLNEQRAPVILGRDGASGATPEIVDESGLRFYASQHQTRRVQAEIARLRRLYPNWTVPADLDTLKPSPPEEAPMWDLFTAGRFEDLRNAIAARQALDPDWQPSDDLARKLNRGTLRSEVKVAARDGDWDAILARVKAVPDVMRSLDVDIAWLMAEAYARTGDLTQSFGLYRAILTSQSESSLRLATVQKAMASLPMGRVEPLLLLGLTTADGSNEFQSIRLDVTRARIVAILHDETVGRVEAADLAALGEHARRLGEPDQMSLLGWYAYRRRQFREALDWFKAGIARGGDARVATGLALALRGLGQEREAEEVAFAWRGPSVTNTALYLDIVERRLTQAPVAPLEADRLDRFVKLVLATSSGEGAQALGWYAYNACQFEAAADWFQRAAAWKPRETAMLGYALTLGRLKRTREQLDVLNRYDGLFSKVVDLALPGTDPEGRDPSPCASVRPASTGLAVASALPKGRVPKPRTDASSPAQDVPLKRGEFPIAVSYENPLRFPESIAERGREGEYLQEARTTQPPLVARRVLGVGAMPYERYGFALLPGWNGLDRPSLLGGPATPPVGTLAQAEIGTPSLAPASRGAGASGGDRFGPFDTLANAARGDVRNPGREQ